MLDPKLIKEKPEIIRNMLKSRAVEFDLDELIKTDEKRREFIIKTDELRKKKNQVGIRISEKKKAKEDASLILAEMKNISSELTKLESEQEEIESHTNNGDDQGHDDRRLYPNGGGENSKSGLQYSLEKNFGEIEFDFDLRHVTLRSIGEDFDSHSNKPPLLMAKISMDQLDGQSYMPGGNHLSNEDFRIEAAAMAAALASERGGRQEGDWICIDHRGRENKLYNIMSYVTTGILLKNRLNFQMITLIVALFYIVRRLCNKNKSNNNNKSSSSSLLLFPTPPKII